MTDEAREPAPPVASVAADLDIAVPPAADGAPDPYGWMRDPGLPALHDYLAAERA